MGGGVWPTHLGNLRVQEGPFLHHLECIHWSAPGTSQSLSFNLTVSLQVASGMQATCMSPRLCLYPILSYKLSAYRHHSKWQKRCLSESSRARNLLQSEVGDRQPASQFGSWRNNAFASAPVLVSNERTSGGADTRHPLLISGDLAPVCVPCLSCVAYCAYTL